MNKANETMAMNTPPSSSSSSNSPQPTITNEDAAAGSSNSSSAATATQPPSPKKSSGSSSSSSISKPKPKPTTTTTTTTATSKPKQPIKPKRPLSAFNLFYRYKRQKVLAAVKLHGPSITKASISLLVTAPPALETDSAIINTTRPYHNSTSNLLLKQDLPLRRQAIRADLESNLEPRETRHRAHRKDQSLAGQMSFVEMGKVMNESWRNCDEFAKTVFGELAEEGRVRYRTRVDEYQAQCKVMEETERRMNGDERVVDGEKVNDKKIKKKKVMKKENDGGGGKSKMNGGKKRKAGAGCGAADGNQTKQSKSKSGTKSKASKKTKLGNTTTSGTSASSSPSSLPAKKRVKAKAIEDQQQHQHQAQHQQAVLAESSSDGDDSIVQNEMAEVMLAMSQRGPAKHNGKESNNVGHHAATSLSMASIMNHENMAAPTSLIDLLATKNIPARPGHVPLRSSMPMNVPNASHRPNSGPIHHHHSSNIMGMGYPQFPNIGAKKFNLPGVNVGKPQQQQQQTPMNHHVPPWDFIHTATDGNNVVIHNNPQEQPPDHNVPSAQELIAAASNLTNGRSNSLPVVSSNNTINGQVVFNNIQMHRLNNTTLRGPANTSPNMMDTMATSLPLPPTDLSRVSTGGSQELMTRVRELEDQLTRERLQARVRELEVEMSQRRQREGILRSVIDTVAISSNRGSSSLGRGRGAGGGGGGASSSSAGGHSSLAAATRTAAAASVIARGRGHTNPSSRGNAPGMQANNNNLPPDGLWGLVSASMIHPSVQDTERAAMLSRMIEPRGGSAATASTAHQHRRRQHHHHNGMSSRVQPTLCASSGSPSNSPQGLVNAASKKRQLR